ncbi:MAG: ATP-binding cassette domain-containing protein [Acidimicrobiales bacterium]
MSDSEKREDREEIVNVKDLVVEYQSEGYAVRPLDGFSMTAAKGELVALLGPSGSGKTTLLSVLSGMVPATEGAVSIDGVNVLELGGSAMQDFRRNTIGIVFQGFNLIPSLNARENVAAPLLVAGVGRKEALARADELLAEVGMSDRVDHKPTQLSGGQQQRVAVARGLVGDPAVLLADEPTANLDLISAEAVISLLRGLRESGRTIVISTHDNRLLPACDRVIEMATAATGGAASADDEAVEPPKLEFAAGDIVFRQGDQSDFVYEIESGTVEVYRELADGGETVLATLTTGNYFGELGPLLGFPRSASIRATSDVRLTSLTSQEFKLKGVERTVATQL